MTLFSDTNIGFKKFLFVFTGMLFSLSTYSQYPGIPGGLQQMRIQQQQMIQQQNQMLIERSNISSDTKRKAWEEFLKEEKEDEIRRRFELLRQKPTDPQKLNSQLSTYQSQESIQ